MQRIKILVTPDMYRAIRNRADEIRALRGMRENPENLANPIWDDIGPVIVDLETIGALYEAHNIIKPWKIRYIGRPSHQAEYVENKIILAIPLNIPSCNHPDIETCVKYARQQLGDIFPHNFNYKSRLIRLFEEGQLRRKDDHG